MDFFAFQTHPLVRNAPSDLRTSLANKFVISNREVPFRPNNTRIYHPEMGLPIFGNSHTPEGRSLPKIRSKPQAQTNDFYVCLFFLGRGRGAGGCLAKTSQCLGRVSGDSPIQFSLASTSQGFSALPVDSIDS